MPWMQSEKDNKKKKERKKVKMIEEGLGVNGKSIKNQVKESC